jgi:hypothetical protein
MKKVTWNDLYEATPKELIRAYKLIGNQLEVQVRRHLDGSNSKERRDLYDQLFKRR